MDDRLCISLFSLYSRVWSLTGYEGGGLWVRVAHPGGSLVMKATFCRAPYGSVFTLLFIGTPCHEVILGNGVNIMSGMARVR